jgi:NAD(P)H-flavin reductase
MDDESWDEAEYNFFSSLSDEDKLYYIYDVITEEYIEIEDTYVSSVEITITDTHLIITCDEPEMSKKFISSFVMDGMILEFQEQKNIVTFYKIVGNTENMSVN